MSVIVIYSEFEANKVFSYVSNFYLESSEQRLLFKVKLAKSSAMSTIVI